MAVLSLCLSVRVCARARCRACASVCASGSFTLPVCAGGPGSAPAPRLTAIEAVFQRHMQGSLSGYTRILEDIGAKRTRRQQAVLDQYTQRVDAVRAAHKLALKLTPAPACVPRPLSAPCVHPVILCVYVYVCVCACSEGESVPPPVAAPVLTRTASLEDSERIVAEANGWRDAQLEAIQRQHGECTLPLYPCPPHACVCVCPSRRRHRSVGEGIR